METTENTQTKTLIEQIFYMFCSKNDEMRPVINNPFELNGYVYATNAFILIRAKKKDVDFDASKNQHKAPNCEEVMPLHNTTSLLELDHGFLDQYKTADEVAYSGKDIDCPTCDGEGEVEWKFEDYRRDFECPVCNGSGYQTQKREYKTGNKTFGDFRIKVDSLYIKINYLDILLKVGEMVNSGITLKHYSTIYILFSVGIFEVLIMPVMHHESTCCDGVIDISDKLKIEV